MIAKIFGAASAAFIVCVGYAYASPEMSEEEVNQRNCMVEAILFEAGNQSLAGKYAVARVIKNRVESTSFPGTVCDVVHEGPVYKWWLEKYNKRVPIKHRCQFSYYCDGLSDNIEKFYGSTAYKEALLATEIVMGTEVFDFTEGALYYHADYVNPKWSNYLKRIVQIGNHIFYK